MNLIDAKALRDVIRAETSCHCIVPLGHGPDGYFARIFAAPLRGKPVAVDFYSIDAAKAYFTYRDVEKQQASRPRSPIEIAIDRACGLEQT